MLDWTHFDLKTMLVCLCAFMRCIRVDGFQPWGNFRLLSRFYGCILCACVMGGTGSMLNPSIHRSIYFILSLSLSLSLCVSLSVCLSLLKQGSVQVTSETTCPPAFAL